MWSPVDFASHFTILANIFAACLWLGLVIPRFAPRRRDVLRGAAVVYMLTTAVVYNTLLTETPARVPWATIVLHVVAPVAVTIEWLVLPPCGRQLSWHNIGWWLVFPAMYVVYTLARGRVSGWYPYYFLNPSPPHSYLVVGLYCFAIGFGIALLGAAVTWVGNRRAPDDVRA